MTAESLLNNMDATLFKRVSVADKLSKNQNLLEDFIEIISNGEELSLKALMAVEVLGRNEFQKLRPYMPEIISSAKLYLNSSSRRCLAKIFSFAIKTTFKSQDKVLLTSDLKIEISELSFLWLISDEKTAVKVFSMQNLYELRHEAQWIKEELKGIIEKALPSSSAGYKSRAVKILRKLKQ